MANPLTGDFEAVLQVSGATVNRLLATLHQNTLTNPALPRFPHSIQILIGADHPIGGVRGLVHAQAGVPRIDLIHGATDRFWLEVSIRAWFRPDPASAPFPGFIHGTVRAQYHFQDIDPTCLGWSGRASKYLWVRVLPDTVTFRGNTADDTGTGVGAVVIPAVVDEAAIIASVQHQIAALLARRFEAMPHPIAPGFPRHLMRSLNVPVAGAAVAVATSLSGAAPSGALSSIAQPFLDGADLGLGIDIRAVLALAQPMLDKVGAMKPTFPVHVDLPFKDFDTVYRVSVDPPSMTWQGHGWYGALAVKIHGRADTDSIAANAVFDVEQEIRFQFDSGRGTVVAYAMPAHVTASASGLYHGTVVDRTIAGLSAAVPPVVNAALAQVQVQLDTIPSRTNSLAAQLRTIDQQAGIAFNTAVFTADGIVVRGPVAVSRRHAPVVVQTVLPSKDGHTALESWIPGGRIDRFDWSWTWSFSSTPPGKSTQDDRFLLRRPRGKAGKWGVGLVQTPVPGLDGWGTLCLTIRGVHVDADTGALVPVVSAKRCHRFGWNISDVIRDGRDRLPLVNVPELSQDVPFPQLSHVRVGDAHVASDAANTLVLFAGERWTADSWAPIEDALEQCGRYDAGLVLLILFREGGLERIGLDGIRHIEDAARRAGIAAIVNEDVHGSWASALGLPASDSSAGLVLLSPRGAVTWRHEGRIDAAALRDALDLHLHPSPDAAPSPARSSLVVGSPLHGASLISGLFDLEQSRCPPLPFGRGDAVVTFVTARASSSATHLRQLFAEYGQDPERHRLVVAVVDGADARQAAALKQDLGLDFVVVGDRTGVVADRLGITTWPTTAIVDAAGTVSSLETGVRVTAAGREARDPSGA